MAQTVLLGDIGRVITGKTPPKAEPDYWGDVLDFITPTDFADSKHVTPKRQLSTKGEKAMQRIVCPANSVMVTCIGSDMGKSAISKRAFVSNQQINTLVVDKTKANPQFVYYLLKLNRPLLRKYAESGGSTMPIINKSTFEKLIFEIPELNDQKKIADILESMDEKIEMNRKMSETLEQMGQTLFREYYSSNHNAKSMSLKKIANLDRGVEPGSKNYTTVKLDNSVPFLRVGDLSKRSSNLFVNHSLTKGKLANPDDVLVSFDGAPGLVGLGLSGCYSSGIRKISPKNNDITKAYLYFLMKSQEVQTIIDRYAEGTTIKHASRSIAHIAAPYVDGCEIEELLSNIFQQLLSNILQTKELSSLRDTLLPRLISGKIKI